MSKPKTQEQIDRATDQRLLKEYGKGLDWYNKQFERQNHGCAVCGDGPGTRRLHVDHDHTYTKVKLISKKTDGVWEVKAGYRTQWYFSYSRFKKSEAVRAIKQQLKIASVRGLLCHRCNRAMILLRDKPELLRKAAEYLENFGCPLSGQGVV